MRLLLAHPNTTWNGVRRGGERYLDDLVAWAVGAGHDVHVATLGRSGREHYPRAGAWVHELDVGAGPGADERFGEAVEGLLRKPPDGRAFDLVHALEAPAALGAAAAGTPVVLSVLGLPRGAWLAERPSYRRQLEAAGQVVDVLCGLSRCAADAVAVASRAPVRVLPPGVRAAAFPLDVGPRDGRTVLFASAVGEPRKRFADLVGALEDVPEARLVVVGPGDPAPVLATSPAVAARTTVVPSEQADLAAAYAAASVTAMPALDEAFGLVALESLACGTPVLVAPGSGPAEVVDASVGTVAEDLAGGLRELLGQGRDPRACRERALTYDWAQVGPAHEEVWSRARGTSNA